MFIVYHHHYYWERQPTKWNLLNLFYQCCGNNCHIINARMNRKDSYNLFIFEQTNVAFVLNYVY